MKVCDQTELLADGTASVTIHDVVNGNTQHLEALIELYLSLMRPYENYVPMIRKVAQRAPNADPRFIDHQWLATVNGEPAGATIFRYSPEHNCGLGFALAVKKEFRECTVRGYDRFAHLLNRGSLDQLCEDAREMGRPVPVGLMVEAEAPDTTDDPERQRLRAHLLRRYSDYGLTLFPIEYLEPPDMYPSPDQAPIDLALYHRMVVGVFPIAGSPLSVHDPAVVESCLSAMLLDHYGLSAEHPAYLQMLGELKHA